MDNMNNGQDNRYPVDPENNSYKYTGEPTVQNTEQGAYNSGAATQGAQSQYSSQQTTAQSSSYSGQQTTAQGSTYSNQNGQSAYHSPYASQNTGSSYNYTTASSVKPEKKKREDKGHLSFGALIGRTAAVAVVFGLIAGAIFGGINYLIPKNGQAIETTATTGVKDDIKIETTSDATKDDQAAIQTTIQPNSAEIVVTDVSDIVENTMPSIVAITNMSVVEYRNLWGQTISEDSESAGSGFIVAQDDEYLYIATNNHVVKGANTLTVQFCDGSAAAAEIKGTSEANDLAVVKVALTSIESETKNAIKVAVLNDKGEEKVGEAAIAIGNALGYGQSVTVGVISALDREVSSYDSYSGETTTNTVIQTDAAINHGNSGGALLNIRGEVIGINTAKYEDVSVEGMGFAIPMDVAAPIINDLITREKVEDNEASYLGINGVNVTTSIAESYGMPEGICIAKVYEGSPAADAGLMKGDIIYEFDGHSISTMEELQELMQYRTAGTEVVVKYYRAHNGEYLENFVTVVLGKKY